MKPFNAQTRKYYILMAAVLVIAAIFAIVMLVHVSNIRKYQDYYNNGMQYYESGDYANAAIYLEKAVEAQATEDAITSLAECYIRLGERDKAISLLEKYQRLPAVAEMLERVQNMDTDTATVTIGGETIPVTAKSVSLANRGLTSEDIQPLEKLTNLESASLNGNKITDIQVLSGLTHLTTLNLADNQITDISVLSGLSNLKILYLDGNQITDFTPLYGLQNLRMLSIRNISIKEKTLQELKAALPNCRIHAEQGDTVEDITIGGKTFRSDVTELDLSGLGITDIQALEECTALVSLTIRDNSISDLSPLMGLSTLKTLDAANNRISDLSPLMGLTSLQYLDLSDNYVTAVDSLGGLASLYTLKLSGNSLQGFAAFSNLRSLQVLDLRYTGIRDGNLQSLYGLSNLQDLYLEGNSLSQSAVDALQSRISGCSIHHSTLENNIVLGNESYPADATSVDASGKGISDVSAVSGFTRCTTLNLSNNRISDISPLAAMTWVENLDLSENLIEDLTPLKSMTGLRVLNLSNNPYSDITPLLQLTGLQRLYVSDESVNISDLQLLQQSLPECEIYFNGRLYE